MTTKKPSAAGGGNESDPVKERFKAALEKKQGAKGGSGAPTAGSAKNVGPNSASGKTQKMFRRKSGGS